MMRTIEVIVSPKGETTVQTKGFAGSNCREASQLIERALGVVQSDRPTAEMYQSSTVQPMLQQKSGS